QRRLKGCCYHREGKKEERGTDIVLHVNEESTEFLEHSRIRSILKKFCSFLPVAIYLDAEEEGKEAEKINNTEPAWTKKPSDLTDKDYQDFYSELYPFSEPPLFWIHLNVDYPFNLTGILYFPKVKHSYEIQKDKIQLYSNQVFVTDEVKDIVPEFLMLLHGVIDSPDIPLNVSRSYLQGDPNVRKINSYITRKVADKLAALFKDDRKSYEEKWESIGLFVKYGMITDDKFLEKAKDFVLFQEVDGKYDTPEEYKSATEANQKNKEGKHIIIYTSDPVQQNSYVKGAEARGYKVVKLETLIDSAFVNNIEMKWQDVRFVRVDSDIAENLVDKSENKESVLTESEIEKLKELFKTEIEGMHTNIDVKGLSPDEKPVVAVRPEFMRRMKDMSEVNGGMYGNLPDEINLVLNGNHHIYRKLLDEKEESKQKDMARNLADMALLSQGLLKGNELSEFIDRSIRMMEGQEKSRIITDI
ncbi:MAG TPA: molecular chaperone HtpG, partial [Ginsengibacter sp.]|nr:molecular chaperone HtpG [Ginsengibacter sp.]